MWKVILVDDEPLALERLRLLLEKQDGYEIIGAYQSADDAIEGLKDVIPDIVITDICMPKTDGLDMIGQMQKKWGKQIGFIIVSGYDQFEYAKKAVSLGVCDYLLKPVIAIELKAALERVCDKLDKWNDLKTTACKGAAISKDFVLEEINQAEEIVKSIRSFREDQIDMVLNEVINDDFFDRNQKAEKLYRIFILVFTMIDTHAGHTQNEFQTLWQQKMSVKSTEYDSNIQKTVRDIIRLCMLKLLEEQAYQKKYAVTYMKLYMYQNYAEDISLAWFAEKLYANTAYLGQKFKKETGESVGSFLHKIRIEKAKEIAGKTDQTWREIAEIVGYKSYLNFFEHFIKVEGKTPSDYKA